MAKAISSEDGKEMYTLDVNDIPLAKNIVAQYMYCSDGRVFENKNGKWILVTKEV